MGRRDGTPGRDAGTGRRDGMPGWDAGIGRWDRMLGWDAGTGRREGTLGWDAEMGRWDGTLGRDTGIGRWDGTPVLQVAMEHLQPCSRAYSGPSPVTHPPGRRVQPWCRHLVGPRFPDVTLDCQARGSTGWSEGC